MACEPIEGSDDLASVWTTKAADFTLGAAIAAAAFVTRPFGGIVGDARIYMGRALADTDPDHVGRDLMFRYDGQSGFTVFRPLARWAVAHLGLEAATWLLGVGGLLLYSVAIFACVRSFRRGRALAVVLAAGLLLSRYYSPFDLLGAGEALAVPRPWSEACVLFALACLADRRPGAAFALIGLGALFHPIMAMPGAILLLMALCAADRRWIVASAIGASAVLLLAALGAPLASRLFIRIDPTWLGILRLRNAYLFVSTWHLDVWCRLVVQAVTIVIACRYVPPVWSRLLLASLLIGLLGCLLSFVGVDLLSSLLLAQVQLWRSLWLPAALAPVAAGVCLAALPRDGWKGWAILSTLTAAWVAPFLAPSNAMLALIALAFATSGTAGVRLHKAACLGAAAFVACTFALSARLVLGFLSVLPSDMHMATSNLEQLSFATFGAVAIVAWCGTTLRGAKARLVAAACLLTTSTLALARYDERTAAKADIDSAAAKSELVAMLKPHPGEVLWLGGEESWSWARRPNWDERIQGAGLVFSRELALIWYDRTRALVAASLAGADLIDPWKAGVAHSPLVYSGKAVAELCRRNDAPSWIVMPLPDGVPEPTGSGIEVWTSSVDERKIVLDMGNLVLRSASRRLVIPCASAFR